MSDSISPSVPVNPYAPPQANILPSSAEAPEDAERIRHELLKHETSIRSVGLLYLFNAVGCAIGLIVLVIAAIMGGTGDGVLWLVGISAFYGLMGWLTYYVGRGLRRLDANVRTGTTILAAIGLLAIPLGTLISLYILYLLHSEKGKRVMTPEYQAVVAQTPHIKYRTPVWLIVLIVLFVALVVFGLVAAFNS